MLSLPLIGRSWAALGLSWAALGLSWGALGPLLAALGPILGHSWPLLGRSWGTKSALKALSFEKKMAGPYETNNAQRFLILLAALRALGRKMGVSQL